MEIAVASGEVALAAIEEKKIIEETKDINEITDKKIIKMQDTVNEMKKLIF